jgi:large subunit ribosomal protein L18
MRVRKRVFGETERPRLSVFRSLNHIYAQVIDDLSGRTLLTASTRSEEIRGKVKNTGSVEAAKEVGRLLGEKAKSAQIGQVAYDRNGYRYHGRVKALADAARGAGLKI